MFKFKPEDFIYDSICSSYAADVANDLLEKYLKTCPVVYGASNTDGSGFYSDIKTESDTRRAYLFNIEPIKKPKCKHEKIDIIGDISGTVLDHACKKCGAKLKPVKWEEV